MTKEEFVAGYCERSGVTWVQEMEMRKRMGQYDEMDKRILAAVKERNSPIYDMGCNVEAERLAEVLGCAAYRVIDRRLQSLRKAGKIRHFTKAEKNGQGGWYVA